MILGKIIAVSLDKVINHLLDGVDIKLTACVRVKHCRLIDMFFFEGCGSLDCQKLNIDVGHVHCGALNGQSADMAGVNSVAVDKAGNLNACLCGQVGYQMVGVENITAYLNGIACYY